MAPNVSAMTLVRDLAMNEVYFRIAPIRFAFRQPDQRDPLARQKRF
jgi:hypothetical protein